MNINYVYNWDRNRYAKARDKPLRKKENLNALTIHNGYLLPPKPKKGRIMGAGGVLDNRCQPVKNSYIITNANRIDNDDEDCFTIYMGGDYLFSHEDVVMLEENVIYLGYITNHWGHFLIDFTTRLWYPIRHKTENKKMVFLIQYGQENFSLIAPIVRFLDLLGIDDKNILFINRVSMSHEIIVPEQSYLENYYTSEEHISLFETVCKNANNKFYHHAEKIYFTRKHFLSARKKEIGEEMLVQLFKENGFEIISPEEYTLDEQIYMIRHAKILAGINGTSMHNLLFSGGETTCVIINKTYIINNAQIDITKMKNVHETYVDAYAALFPISLGSGPFLFVMNDNLKRYITENNYKFNTQKFENAIYIREKIDDYVKLFKSNSKYKDWEELKYDLNQNSAGYFPPELLRYWMRKYYLMCMKDESDEDKTRNRILEQSNIIKDLKKKIKSLKKLREHDLKRAFLCIETHFSRLGWKEVEWEGEIVGDVNSNEQLEAIKMYFSSNAGDVIYSIYHEGAGWSEYVKNGVLAGSVGKSLPILGVKICLDRDTMREFDIYYRLHGIAGKWSGWYKNGAGIYGDRINAIQVYIKKKSVTSVC